MNPDLLEYLCDPLDKSSLTLTEAQYGDRGHIVRGILISSSGRRYPIRDGVPRFESDREQQDAVESFGDEWNRFNFADFHLNWLNHTVKNTFGSLDAFCGKVIVDAGAGSGMQTRWMRHAGAAKVIALELSHSVDGIMKENLRGLDGVDVIQCSIDRPADTRWSHQRCSDLPQCYPAYAVGRKHCASLMASCRFKRGVCI